MPLTKKRKLPKHIKKAKTGGYQIQMIINKKSYSDFAMTLVEAVIKRNKMYVKLKTINTKKTYKTKPNKSKTSALPDGSIMACGIHMSWSLNGKGPSQLYLFVTYHDIYGKQKLKSFYVGTEKTTTDNRIMSTYRRALDFRYKFLASVKKEQKYFRKKPGVKK